MRNWILLLALLACLPAGAGGTLYHVGSGQEYASVREAITSEDVDADSTTADTIVVHAGTYSDADASPLTWKIGVHLMAIPGDAPVLRDTHITGKRFASIQDCGYGLTVTGLTFEDYNAQDGALGVGNRGGAFLLFNSEARTSSVTFTDCTFDNCDAGGSGLGQNSGSGGAIYAFKSAGYMHVTLEGCTFTNCNATLHPSNDADAGGAVSLIMLGGVAWIEDCTFGTSGNGNSIVGSTGSFECIGGALKSLTTETYVRNCTFTDNAAEYGGALSLGGLSNTETCEVTGSTFTNNSATVRAGAVLFEHGGPYLFADCIFTGNSAPDEYAGAISGHYTTVVYDACEFYDNTAEHGGAVVCGGTYGATPVIGGETTFRECIFQGNSSDTDGGAVYVPSASSPTNAVTFENCILVDNAAGGEGAHVYYKLPGLGTLNLTLERTILRLGDAAYGIGTNAVTQAGLAYSFTCLDTVAAGTQELLKNTPNATAETVCTDCTDADPGWCTWTDNGTADDDFRLAGESTLYGTAACGQIGPYWCSSQCGTGCWSPPASSVLRRRARVNR